MRRLFYSICLVAVFATASFAQQPDYPKADFTGAFTAVHLDGGGHLFGFTAAPAYNFKKHLAVEGDLTYTTSPENGARFNLFTYMAGVRYTVRGKRLQPFVHALVGGAHISDFGFHDTGWSGKFGGGLDIVATKHIAVRVFQVDYFPTGFNGFLDNHASFTFGVRIN